MVGESVTHGIFFWIQPLLDEHHHDIEMSGKFHTIAMLLKQAWYPKPHLQPQENAKRHWNQLCPFNQIENIKQLEGQSLELLSFHFISLSEATKYGKQVDVKVAAFGCVGAKHHLV